MINHFTNGSNGPGEIRTLVLLKWDEFKDVPGPSLNNKRLIIIVRDTIKF